MNINPRFPFVWQIKDTIACRIFRVKPSKTSEESSNEYEDFEEEEEDLEMEELEEEAEEQMGEVVDEN